MKTIENLLQEYKIRFRDTEKIKEEVYPDKVYLRRLASANGFDFKIEIE